MLRRTRSPNPSSKYLLEIRKARPAKKRSKNRENKDRERGNVAGALCLGGEPKLGKRGEGGVPSIRRR